MRKHHNQNHQVLIDFDQGLFDRRFLPIFGSSFCNQKFPMDATVAGKRLKAPPTTELNSATFWAWKQHLLFMLPKLSASRNKMLIPQARRTWSKVHFKVLILVHLHAKTSKLTKSAPNSRDLTFRPIITFNEVVGLIPPKYSLSHCLFFSHEFKILIFRIFSVFGRAAAAHPKTSIKRKFKKKNFREREKKGTGGN